MPLFYRISWLIIMPIAKLFFGFSVKGVENFPKSGAVVVASNHASYLDPVIVGLALPRQIFYLARKSLFKNPWFAALIKYYGAYPLSRSDAKGMLTALRLLKESKPLLVFPEGTRTLDGKLQPVKTGAAWLAFHGKCPIVPVWIEGSFESYPKGRKFPKTAKITVAIGKPINPIEIGGKDDEENITLATNDLQDSLAQFEQNFTEQKNLSTD